MTIIMVVVREFDTNGKVTRREELRFRDVPGEPKQMEEFVNKVYKYRPQAVVSFVNCTRPTPPPPTFKQTDSWWWCPYCAKGREFRHYERLNVLRCEVCGMTHLNFYVRLYNVVPDRLFKTTSNNEE